MKHPSQPVLYPPYPLPLSNQVRNNKTTPSHKCPYLQLDSVDRISIRILGFITSPCTRLLDSPKESKSIKATTPHPTQVKSLTPTSSSQRCGHTGGGPFCEGEGAGFCALAVEQFYSWAGKFYDKSCIYGNYCDPLRNEMHQVSGYKLHHTTMATLLPRFFTLHYHQW